MGVEDFTEIVKKHAPDSVQKVNLSVFAGQRIAVDINNLIYHMMSPCVKDVAREHDFVQGKPDYSEVERKALTRILDHLMVFLNHQIVPVCLFDGFPHSLKKTGNPKKKKKKTDEREAYQKAKTDLYSKEPMFRLSPLVDAFVKLYLRRTKVKTAFLNQLHEILAGFGFPVYDVQNFEKMSNDAEGLCAGLCLAGNDYCVAGYTTDSDFHAYGGNIQIMKVESSDRSKNGVVTRTYFAQIRRLDMMLNQFSQEMGKPFPFSAFQDLCIMLGTDFNPRIPRQGPVKCWDNIVNCLSIDVLAQRQNVELLNHHEVRKMYQSFLTRLEISMPNMNCELFEEIGGDIAANHQLLNYYRIFYEFYYPGGKKTESTQSVLYLDPDNPDKFLDSVAALALTDASDSNERIEQSVDLSMGIPLGSLMNQQTNHSELVGMSF